MNKQRRFFITGTDTDVGKTLVTACMVEQLQAIGCSVTAIKPVAAGCQVAEGELVNFDALTLLAVMNQSLDYSVVNPIALQAAIAPHIAAEEEGVELSVEILRDVCDLEQHSTDFILIEGAGGWCVPLNDEQTLADFAVSESLDIILVVGLKLGCISHALLTVQAIHMAGLNLAGWVANVIDPDMLVIAENIETLKRRINAPLIAEIPFIESDNLIQEAAEYVNIAPLVNMTLSIH